MTTRITANSVLPALREPISLITSDGLRLVGELATPLHSPPAGTIICIHPLPTHGGMMDSHLFRKAAWRLPALAHLAVLRFNTRGTTSAAGTSEGRFRGGDAEGADLAAAVAFARGRGLPEPWLVGWSFGTEVILRHPPTPSTAGVILISPPLRSTTAADLAAWQHRPEPMLALIPELDDYLRPAVARERFAPISRIKLVPVAGAKHLLVGEPNVRIVLNEIVAAVAPAQLDPETGELPTEWSAAIERWSDL